MTPPAARTGGCTRDAETRLVRVAGLAARSVAALVDALLLAPVLGACGLVVRWVEGTPLPRARGGAIGYALDLALTGHPLVAALAALAVVLALLYQFLFCAFGGATPGLRAMGLRVVGRAGETPGVAGAAARALATVAAAAPLGLGLLWIGFDREKRGLHDHLAGTYVVRMRQHTSTTA